MLIECEGKRPRVAPSAYVAPTAVVSGDVTVGDECRILFNAVVTADAGTVELGRRCIVMEHALIRGRERHPTRIADHVIVGPHAHLNGVVIEDNVFIATGASAFPGARIGTRAEVRINGVVHANTVLPADGLVPIGWVAVGDPAQVFPPSEHERIWEIQRDLDFPGTVFGVARPDEGSLQSVHPQITERYAELFGRHRKDVILNG